MDGIEEDFYFGFEGAWDFLNGEFVAPTESAPVHFPLGQVALEFVGTMGAEYVDFGRHEGECCAEAGNPTLGRGRPVTRSGAPNLGTAHIDFNLKAAQSGKLPKWGSEQDTGYVPRRESD